MAIISKSFARIHETNLKKQGILPLTFANAEDYERIGALDRISLRISGDESLAPGKQVKMIVDKMNNGIGVEKKPINLEILLNHTMSPLQIEWFKAGSCANYIANSLLK